MKPKTMLKIACLLGCVLYALLTGGVVINNLKWFGGQRSVCLVKGLQSDLFIDTNFSGWGIPFVGFYYSSSMPYSLCVHIRDESLTYTRIKIHSATVKYKSGEKEEIAMEWARDLKPYNHSYYSEGEMREMPVFMLSGETIGLIKKRENCEVTLRGILTSKTGEDVPFETTERFEYKPKLYLITLWEHIAGC